MVIEFLQKEFDYFGDLDFLELIVNGRIFDVDVNSAGRFLAEVGLFLTD
jgi:hypothetical protein